jgi:microcompartment protein CcmK/EutM
MQLATVIGHATSTIKHESFIGWRFLIVQPLNAAHLPEADPVLAIDKFGSGVGAKVVIGSDGKGARLEIGNPKSPVRWYVLAVADKQGE